MGLVIHDGGPTESPVKYGFDLPVGTLFRGNINHVKGIFLRTYDAIVYLDNPKETWVVYPPDKRGHGSPSIYGFEAINAVLKVTGRE